VYIDNKADLAAFIERAQNSDILSLDTEFLREKTYYAKLCLLQMATRDEIVIVDPIRVPDITPLAVLLEDENIVKIFHASKQDLEILYHEVGVLPRPVFDTQIAASMLGNAQQVGLGALVSKICNVNLKKSDSFTDWSKRPLTPSQIEYAEDDVRYLAEMYDNMQAKLRKLGRQHWLDEDFAMLSDYSSFEEDPRERYLHLKRFHNLSRRQLSAAREVTAWREVFAQNHDIPRKWVLTDEQIVEICRKEATNVSDLFLIRGVREKLNTEEARKVAHLVEVGLNVPENELPEENSHRKNEPNVDELVDVMTAIARVRAKENNVALQTLASHADLEALARGHRAKNDLMTGWRKKMIGNDLIKLLEGKMAIRILGGQLTIEENL